jgi:hypothetical protein
MDRANHRPRRFSDDQVRAIRRDPRPLRAIAPEYDTTTATISCIKSGKLFSDVQPLPGETAFLAPPGPRPKLTDADVLAIKASTESNKVLALQFGVTPVRIWQIKRKP